MTALRPAVFLDRDGTLIEDTGYLRDPQLVRVLPTVAQALRAFESAGYLRIVVSNQSGIARGLISPEDVERVAAAMQSMLAVEGVSVDAIYICPHLDEGCECRKPMAGMLLTAAARHGIDLSRSAMIGDRGSDIAAGHAAGLPAVLVTTGPLVYDGPNPDVTVATLLDAANWILARD